MSRNKPLTPDEIADRQDASGVGRDAPIDLGLLLGKAARDETPPPKRLPKRAYWELPS